MRGLRTRKVLKLSIDPSGQFVREYFPPEPPLGKQKCGRAPGGSDPAKTENRLPSGRVHSTGVHSVTCDQFRRLITPAVDGRLHVVRQHSFDRHARECQACREQYEIEAAVKQAVRRHLPRVKAPQALRDSITRQIRGTEGERRWHRTLGERLRGLVKLPFLLPVLVVLLACTAIAVMVTMNRQGSPDERNNLVVHMLQAHRLLESGVLLPDVMSADAEHVQSYLSSRTNVAVVVPLLAGFVLTGGRAETYEGLRMAHLVYRRGNAVASILEMHLEDILHSPGLALPLNIRNELMHTGWYSDDRENGESLVLWTRGTTLCAAIARMGRSDLQGELSRLEGNSPTETLW